MSRRHNRARFSGSAFRRTISRLQNNRCGSYGPTRACVIGVNQVRAISRVYLRRPAIIESLRCEKRGFCGDLSVVHFLQLLSLLEVRAAPT